MGATGLYTNPLGTNHHFITGERHGIVDAFCSSMVGYVGLLQLQVHHFRRQVGAIAGLIIKLIQD